MSVCKEYQLLMIDRFDDSFASNPFMEPGLLLIGNPTIKTTCGLLTHEIGVHTRVHTRDLYRGFIRVHGYLAWLLCGCELARVDGTAFVISCGCVSWWLSNHPTCHHVVCRLLGRRRKFTVHKLVGFLAISRCPISLMLASQFIKPVMIKMP